MSFRLLYERRFLQDLAKVPTSDRNKIRKRLEWFAGNVLEVRHIRLKGSEFKEVFKLRLANWRIFYRLDFTKDTIYVLGVEDRKEAYRKK